MAGPPARDASERGTPTIETSDEEALAVELDRVCRAAARQLSLLGTAISLMSGAGSEAVAAVSDGETRSLEALQFDLGEGPGRDAFATGRPVLTSDMEAAFARWPAYAAAAHRAGVGSAYAFPLQIGAVRLGVITFYAASPSALDASALNACVGFVDTATAALVDGRRPQIPGVLRFRTEVYQAQGMVMVDLGIDLAGALARMRAHAYASGTDLDQVARDIIAGRTRLEHGDGLGPVPGD
ncbi:GAF and ANTAR domain-containing protein [Nocardioides dilutus]